MAHTIDGKALVYADGAFNTPEGKTAHGLVRFTQRYEIVGVIDHDYAGKDSGMVLDGRSNGIPIFETLDQAMRSLTPHNRPQTLVVGDTARQEKNRNQQITTLMTFTDWIWYEGLF